MLDQSKKSALHLPGSGTLLIALASFTDLSSHAIYTSPLVSFTPMQTPYCHLGSIFIIVGPVCRPLRTGFSPNSIPSTVALSLSFYHMPTSHHSRLQSVDGVPNVITHLRYDRMLRRKNKSYTSHQADFSRSGLIHQPSGRPSRQSHCFPICSSASPVESSCSRSVLRDVGDHVLDSWLL